MPLSDNARSPGAIDRKVRTPPAFGSNTGTMARSMGADCPYTPTILGVKSCGRGRVLVNSHWSARRGPQWVIKRLADRVSRAAGLHP